jgi:[acyl-carrier-protein] S-malonyltransferase
MELAQLEILETFFEISLTDANMMYGFSLGELTALTAGGVLTLDDALKIPLMMSRDAAELADDVTLCVLFSRSGKFIPRKNVHRLCAEINAEGNGVIGVSTFLAPNSMLLIGQKDTVQRLKERKGEITTERISVRVNDDKWPPLHTPIVWQRNITDRAQFLMHTIEGGFTAPTTPLFSMATGAFSYDGDNTRDVVAQWIDKPQLLWEAVDATLARGVETVIHIGPQPNIIPATFGRLAANVELLTKDRLPMHTLSRIVQYGWLSAVLPKRTNLLRAPNIVHVTLEDWLLQQDIA